MKAFFFDTSPVVSNPVLPAQSAFPRWLVMLLVGMLMAAIALTFVYWPTWTDPYVRSVLTLEGHPDRGHAIFQINCAGCHGLEADGGVGPSLHEVSHRRSAQSLIHQVTSGQTPPMPKFQPNGQDMADLLSYLRQL